MTMECMYYKMFNELDKTFNIASKIQYNNVEHKTQIVYFIIDNNDNSCFMLMEHIFRKFVESTELLHLCVLRYWIPIRFYNHVYVLVFIFIFSNFNMIGMFRKCSKFHNIICNIAPSTLKWDQNYSNQECWNHL